MIDAEKGEGYDFVSTFGRECLKALPEPSAVSEQHKRYDLAMKRSAECFAG
jgi:hypothetical protein